MHLMPPLLAWLPHGTDFIWIMFFVGVLCPVVWIAALISCIKNESNTDNTKVVWVILIALFPFFGALAYFLIRRPQRIRELGH